MGGIRYTLRKTRECFASLRNNKARARRGFYDTHTIKILATPHTESVARAISYRLQKVGISTSIFFDTQGLDLSDTIWIVLCPQMFARMPAEYFAFNLEFKNSRHFTPKYFSKLHSAIATFDYSLNNIEWLQSKGFPYNKLFYIPIYNGIKTNNDIAYEYDVLFYGDTHSARRQRILGIINKKFKLKICNNLFGNELQCEIRKAKVVVNIHYDDNSELESTRLSELLQLGKIVVSEDVKDSAEKEFFEDKVLFSSTEKLIDTLSEAIENFDKLNKYLAAKANTDTFDPMSFYLYRAMLAFDLITFDQFYYTIGQQVTIPSFVCLSLTETINRQRAFKKDNPGIYVFQGLRHSIGWIGCGLSYKFLIKRAKDQGLDQITICEDDIAFRNDHDKLFTDISKVLSSRSDWDMFSGLIADYSPDTKILAVDHFCGGDLATINKTVSMVFSVFSTRIYDKLLMWSPEFRNANINTIDRYIQNLEDFRAVCACPYLVAQRDDVNSSLWGFKNTQYNEMIGKSQALFASAIKNYK